MSVSNDSPTVRKVTPYKPGQRQSTFRRLNIGFAGTALEQALNDQENFLQPNSEATSSSSSDDANQSPPVTTTVHQSPPLPANKIATDLTNNKINEKVIADIQSKEHSHQYPPVTTTPQFNLAPERDFNRRANSLERDALPSGLFPGSTKKVYDALYLRTRGAIVPIRSVQASRRDLLTWTGIRNLKTIDNHIRYLMAKGLIIRHWELGSNEGSSYEVVLPEELFESNHSPPVVGSGGNSLPVTTTPQKTGSGYTQKMGSGGEGQIYENTEAYGFPKTIKTNDERKFYDDEAFAEFVSIFQRAAQEINGKKLSASEKGKWAELAKLLVTELKIASARTDNVSSIPAFLTEHLRRRLWKTDKKVSVEADKMKLTKSHTYSKEEIRSCPDCGGSGMYYPAGYDKGVAKCHHQNLGTPNFPGKV